MIRQKQFKIEAIKKYQINSLICKVNQVQMALAIAKSYLKERFRIDISIAIKTTLRRQTPKLCKIC